MKMTFLRSSFPACFLVALLVVAFWNDATVTAIDSMSMECTRNRPGWGNHRTLYIPQGMIMENNDQAWIEALCCVYTYVELIPSSSTSSSSVQLELYDGSEYSLRRESSSFAEVASQAMEDICDMQMGRDDCQEQSECVDRAFAETTPPEEPVVVEEGIKEWTISALPTTTAPTQAPTRSPTTSEAPSLASALVNSTAAHTTNNKTMDWLYELEQALHCTTDRPGWPEHRTLFVADSMLIVPVHNNTQKDTMSLFESQIAWIEALCCVYTYVEFVPATTDAATAAQLKVYDGYIYNIEGESFVEIAETAMHDICGMSMGSDDCESQNECIQNATNDVHKNDDNERRTTEDEWEARSSAMSLERITIIPLLLSWFGVAIAL